MQFDDILSAATVAAAVWFKSHPRGDMTAAQAANALLERLTAIGTDPASAPERADAVCEWLGEDLRVDHTEVSEQGFYFAETIDDGPLRAAIYARFNL